MTDDPRLHGSLVGRSAVRDQLNTPALVIDREALDRNIARMAEYARAHGVACGRTPRPTRACVSAGRPGLALFTARDGAA